MPMPVVTISPQWKEKIDKVKREYLEEHFGEIRSAPLVKEIPTTRDYEQTLRHAKDLSLDAYGEYAPALDQIRREIALHPHDLKWIIGVRLFPHLDESRLVELAREYLKMNVEIRLEGHHRYHYLGDKLVNCVVRR